MNFKLPPILVLIAVVSLSFAARAGEESDQSAFPQIASQPVDQTVLEGDSVSLSVEATNSDGFQWLRNGMPIEGETNSSLALSNVGTNDVGLYSCNVLKGLETVPTRSASLNVAVITPNNQFQVFATVVLSSGSKGSCPGSYVGYVNYTKTVAQGWGWTPAGSPHTASDGTGRTDTKIEYVGKLGDSGCNQASVTVPSPPTSPSYRFTIYFPHNAPSGSYPITLNGFNP